MSAQALGWLMGAAALVALGGSPVRAGIIEPELSVAGGSGVPGGTVSVTVSLADDVDDAGVSAGLDLRFGADALEFFEPVEDSCAVAERLSATHGVAGMLLDPDLLNLEVFVLVGPPPPPPLGNGELVSCDFRIRDGVPAGTVALEIEAPILGNAEGTPIPVRVRNGSVEILAEVPTSTPTATGTPPPTDTPEATPTATETGEVTATATATTTSPPATATATATRTSSPVTPPTATATNTPSTPATATATATRTGATPTATRRQGGGGDGGCNVTSVDASASPGAAALLLLPAVLLWVRRRGR
jgi:MYXO-CTERM domain-containing protein